MLIFSRIPRAEEAAARSAERRSRAPSRSSSTPSARITEEEEEQSKGGFKIEVEHLALIPCASGYLLGHVNNQKLMSL